MSWIRNAVVYLARVGKEDGPGVGEDDQPHAGRHCEVVHLVHKQNLKRPKLEDIRFQGFYTIRPVWVGDLGTRQKIQNLDGLGLKIEQPPL